MVVLDRYDFDLVFVLDVAVEGFLFEFGRLSVTEDPGLHGVDTLAAFFGDCDTQFAFFVGVE